MPTVTHEPTGEYPTSAKVHHLDLQAAAGELVAKLPGHGRQTKNLARESWMSIVMMAMESGDALHEHSAPGTVTVQVLSGHAAISAEEHAIDLRPGELVVFQPNICHDIRAEEQSVVLLTITGTDVVTVE